MAHNPQNRARKPQHQSRALLRAVPGSREQSDADGHAGGAGKICGSYTAVRSPVWIEGRGCCADECVRYTNSLTTQMMFGFRTTSIEDPKLVPLFHVSTYPFTLSHHHKPNTWSMAVLTHARTPGFRALLRPPQLLLRRTARPLPRSPTPPRRSPPATALRKRAAREGKGTLRGPLAQSQEGQKPQPHAWYSWEICIDDMKGDQKRHRKAVFLRGFSPHAR
jgi:hypothetical protein